MSAQWKVERIELLFYNSGENRWDMFQEGTSNDHADPDDQPQSFFRTQLQKLLGTVRKALAMKSGGCVECQSKPTNPSSDVPLDSADIPKEIQKSFADYYCCSLSQEGVADSANIRHTPVTEEALQAPIGAERLPVAVRIPDPARILPAYAHEVQRRDGTTDRAGACVLPVCLLAIRIRCRTLARLFKKLWGWDYAFTIGQCN